MWNIVLGVLYNRKIGALESSQAIKSVAGKLGYIICIIGIINQQVLICLFIIFYSFNYRYILVKYSSV